MAICCVCNHRNKTEPDTTEIVCQLCGDHLFVYGDVSTDPM
jgi:hypothetical protein